MALRNGESLLAQKIARRYNGAETLTAGNSAIFTFVAMLSYSPPTPPLSQHFTPSKK